MLYETQEFNELLADYTHGATVLTGKLLQMIADLIEPGPRALDDLKRVYELLQQAHPEMVSLSKAVWLILRGIRAGKSPRTASHELQERWNENIVSVVEMSANYLMKHHNPHILTISYSGLVRDAILELKRRKAIPQVYVGEGRPRYEGLTLARELAGNDISCTVFADAAFSGFLGEIDCVLIGADAVGPASILNKIGTTAILREAKIREIPTAAAYDFLKVVDENGFPDEITEYSPEELMADSVAQQIAEEAKGFEHIRLVNRYFEVVPRGLVDTELADVTLR